LPRSPAPSPSLSPTLPSRAQPTPVSTVCRPQPHHATSPRAQPTSGKTLFLVVPSPSLLPLISATYSNFPKVGEIISRFEKKGFYLKGLKLITVDCSFAERHYADLFAKPFFNGLVEYIISGRKIIGATNPSDSAPGTIRGDFAVEIGR
ncbi:nucleoside diphosphate kinase-like, partial [Juglans microcarpa x Juglans regia]|uniref:nucleoside diphosphate kinase-like n=1 Tax=Juglans microcarpa x Juglans regia TaxID=2249226 RepID=UPI001B7F5447